MIVTLILMPYAILIIVFIVFLEPVGAMTSIVHICIVVHIVTKIDSIFGVGITFYFFISCRSALLQTHLTNWRVWSIYVDSVIVKVVVIAKARHIYICFLLLVLLILISLFINII